MSAVTDKKKLIVICAGGRHGRQCPVILMDLLINISVQGNKTLLQIARRLFPCDLAQMCQVGINDIKYVPVCSSIALTSNVINFTYS